MKRVLPLAALLLIFPTIALAQSDDYKKWEFFGGYSALFLDVPDNTDITALNDVLSDKNNLRGLNLAVTRNFHRYFGAKFDYSLHLREDNFTRPAGSGTVDTTVQNFLGGIQIKNNDEDGPTFRPFAHALVGVATQKIDIDSPQLPALFGISDFHVNETSFAMAFGGGLDFKVNHRIAIRAIQA
ncbi:MAG TPA: hypothetical protein VIK24_12835, partial [Pyrinomonadaceae bacterium]